MKETNKNRVLQEDYELEIAHRFSRFEIVVYLISIILLTALFIIAFWSGILLATDMTQGGGPLGMLMEALHIDLLL